MPSHAATHQNNIRAQVPLFSLTRAWKTSSPAMTEPQVKLPSGGYLVIHPTEALISIDVNSGRSTTERNVEETALKTNLEAAAEVGRQLRLRDLAGLIVIDFIDMNYGKNRKAVERAMKDALKADRAKIQVGRISMFGLMELSHASACVPLSPKPMGAMCPHCRGTGYIHSVETVGIQIVRTLEKEAASGDYVALRVTTHPEAALYLLNEKRAILQSLEQRYNVTVAILMDATLITGTSRLIKVTSDGREITHEPSNNAQKRGGNRSRRGKRGGRDGQGGGINFDGSAASDASESELAYAASEGDNEIIRSTSENEFEREPREPRAPRPPREPRAPREGGERPRRERGGRNRSRSGERRPRDENAAIATDETAIINDDQTNGAPNENGAVSTDEGNRDRNRRRGRRGGRNRRGNGERGERRPQGDQPSGDANAAQTGHETHGHDASDGASATTERTSARSFKPRGEAAEPTSYAGSYGNTASDSTPAPRPATSPAQSFVIPLSEKQTNPAAVASPIVSESGSGDDKNKRKGWWSRVLES